MKMNGTDEIDDGSIDSWNMILFINKIKNTHICKI